jgi:hypothetical protein
MNVAPRGQVKKVKRACRDGNVIGEGCQRIVHQLKVIVPTRDTKKDNNTSPNI